MMWKKLVSGLLSLAVVGTSLTAAVVNMGTRAAETKDPLVYQQLYEVEDGTLYKVENGGLVEEPREPATEHIGYTGRGFVDQMNWGDGRAVTIKVSVPKAGSYMLGVRFAGNQASTMGVYVGADASKAQTMYFSQAEWQNRGFQPWKTWLTSYMNIELAAGENDITLISRKDVDQNVVNLDSITLTDSTIYEAEDADILPAAKNPSTDHIGYSGRGFIASFSTDGDGLVFHVDAPRAGDYAVAFTYQSQTSGVLDLNLYVNDETEARKVEFPKNNLSWDNDTWSQTVLNLPLDAGENTVKLVKEADNKGGLNIDCMTVSNRLLAAYLVEGGVPNGDFANEPVGEHKTADYANWVLDNAEATFSGINGANDVAGKNLYMWTAGREFSQGISQQLTGLDNGWYAVSFWKKNNNNPPKSQMAELVVGEEGVGSQAALPYVIGTINPGTDESRSVEIWRPVSMAARVTDGNLKIHTAIDGNDGSSLMVGKFQLWRLVDKTDLYDQIASGADLKEGDWSAETWQDYQTALTDAKAALANSTLQSEIDAAEAALAAAQDDLAPPKPAASYTPHDLTLGQIYEAEAGELLGGAVIMRDHSGYTGDGFVAYLDQGGNDRGAAVTVQVPHAGSYMIGVRYAANSASTMAAYLGDDASNAQVVSFFGDNWDNWNTSYFNMELQAGENKITLMRRANADSGVINIDSFSVTDSVIYEAEDAQIIPEHRNTDREHAGFSGDGFITGFGQEGNGISFHANVQRDGDYVVLLRYTNGQSTDRQLELSVDTTAANLIMPCPRTGGWKSWGSYAITVPLKAGENVITIKAGANANDVANVNVDALIVSNGLLSITEVSDAIQNGDFGTGTLDGWTLDDPALADDYVGVNEEPNGVGGNNVYFYNADGDFLQGISQQLTGLDNGWYGVSFQKLNQNTTAQKKMWIDLDTGDKGTDGYFQIPQTPVNVWTLFSTYAQVSDGKLTIHVGNDATAYSSLMIGKFQLWKIVDKTALYDQIASGADLKEGDWSADSWQAYQTALAAANTALAQATTQQAVNDATSELLAKQGALDPVQDGQHTITLQKPDDAQVTLSAATAAAGVMVTVTIDALPTGKVVDTVSAQAADQSDITVNQQPSGAYAFQMPDQDVTVTVTLKAATYSVTAQAGEHGTVSPATQDVEHGQNAVLTLQPESGYELDTVTVAPQAEYEVQGNTVTVKNITAQTAVSVTFKQTPQPALTIRSVAAIPDITVDYGTAFENLELPEQVEVTLSDDSKANATVTWAEGAYDGQTAGDYTLTGALALADVENPDNLTATVKVTVEEESQPALTIQSVAAVPDITVDYGTAFENLELPEQVEVTLSDDSKANATVTWAEGAYDGLTAGDYTLTGALALADVENPDNLTATVKVTVEEEQIIEGCHYVTATAGEHGTITPGSAVVENGEDVVFAILPDEGYEVDTITISSNNAYTLEDGKLTVKTITGVTDISVTFKALPKPVDTTALEEALEEASGLLDQAETGSAPGQYPESAVQAFRAAIEKAQAALDDPSSAAEDIATAVSELTDAQETFLASRVTDDSKPSDPDDTTEPDDSTNPSDTTESGDSSTNAPSDSSSAGGKGQSGGSQNESNNPKTSNTLPALAIGTLLVSGAALWLVSRKRRG